MPIHLSAYDDARTAVRVAGLLRDAGVPTHTMRLHISKALNDHHALTQFDEQATGGLTTNLLSLFDDIFEWGSLPIDTSSYAATVRRGGAVLAIETDSADEQRLATQALAKVPAADLQSGWVGRDAREQNDASPLQSLGAAISSPVTGTAEQDDREQAMKRTD
jgi:hypothetical protein